MPFFSVVIPLFNKEQYIKDTVASVLNQTFTDYEIIVVNDGSTDSSLEIVKRFEDNRIRVINQKNQGLCASRNNGIRLANAENIAFLDADDLWMEDFLEVIHILMHNAPKNKVFATNVKLLHPNIIPDLSAFFFNKDSQITINNYFKISKNIFGPSSLVLNKSIFEEVGFFDESINYGEEDDFYIRCFIKHDIVYYSKAKTYYRTGVKNQLTSPNKKFERKIPDYSAYLQKYNHPDLKKFIDFVHFRLVVLYKMERNKDLVHFYKQKISTKNLKTIQKIKFHLPIPLFYYSKLIYLWFSRIFSHF